MVSHEVGEVIKVIYKLKRQDFGNVSHVFLKNASTCLLRKVRSRYMEIYYQMEMKQSFI